MTRDRVFKLIEEEKKRQQGTINLIASENYASKEVREAAGSVLTNKYAEGLPKKRYYGGTEVVDEIEQLAITRVKKLFRAEHANVQPHSGAQANAAAYMSFLVPGDRVLAMSLDQGGHLTHGSPLNFSGKLYDFKFYGVDKKTHIIDMGEVARLVKRYKPKMIVAGYSAYSRRLDFKSYRQIADSVNAILLVDMAHFAGLAAAGVYPSPVPYADVITSTTHKTLRGPRGGFILCKKQHAELIDKAVFPGTQGGPLEHIIAAKAVGFAEAMKPSFNTYQKQVIKNTSALAKRLMELGAEVLTGGTDNHMFLVDTVKSWGITGRDAEERLGQSGIVVNRNAIPYDKNKPFIASGIRIGTPSATTRGMKVTEMILIAGMIDGVLRRGQKIAREVSKLTKKFKVHK